MCDNWRQNPAAAAAAEPNSKKEKPCRLLARWRVRDDDGGCERFRV